MPPVKPSSKAKPPAKPQAVLLLQGGGALGSYQAGAFEALAAHDYTPDWVIGVSIGAINASLIAGNPPERRVARLREFWYRITQSTAALQLMPNFAPESFEQKFGAAVAILRGQPGFYRPWWPYEWLTQNPCSYYDTSLLRETLLELVDFDLINDGPVRLSLGAVQVASGNMIYFDSHHKSKPITPEHVMASGALPPGFPAVDIDGEAYWDGGLVSNTPLAYFMEHQPRLNSVVFQVDLFSAQGQVPTTLDEVSERQKDIQYSSRTRMVTTEESRRHNLRREVARFVERLPPEFRNDPVAKRLHAFSCPARIDLVHLIYRPDAPQGSQKDYEFDRATCNRRWAKGHEDAETAVTAAPWRTPAPEDVGMRTFDIRTGKVTH
jgi:NTE family protein